MFHRLFFPGPYFAPRYFPQGASTTPAFTAPEVVFTLPQRNLNNTLGGRNTNYTLPQRNMNTTLPRRK